jgi:hypothetical protein
MKKYFVYDIDGCAYYDSIFITNKPLKKGYRYFIAECDSAHEANEKASYYLYDSQRQIDLRYDGGYYEGGDAYPPYDEDEDFIEFIEE